MNSRLRSIVDSYEDFELAFLSEYKLLTYTKNTQEAISEYLLERGLTAVRIQGLIEDTRHRHFLDDSPRCPRCRSKRLINDKVEITEGKDKAFNVNPVYAERISCEICEFYLKDPHAERIMSETIWQKLKARFNRK